jgi:hypothetical protein
METKSFNLEELDYRWHLHKYGTKAFMLLEDNNSVLYFDEGIFYINIETGETNDYNITDLKDFKFYSYCTLENNKFIIYCKNEMMVFKYENKTINKIFSQYLEVDYIFKLFKGEYILIKFENNIKVFHESHINDKEIYHFYIKCAKFGPINYFGDKRENYFFAEDEEQKDIIIKISLNSKNEIAFNKEYLSIKNIKEYKFITGNKLFIELNNKKYVVYDLNYKQVEMVFEYKEKNCLRNIFKGIQGINIGLLKDFLYETNRQNNYVLKRNNNEIYFITKKGFDNIFKVFKYTLVQTNLTPNLYKK